MLSDEWNENRTYQNLRDAIEALPRKKVTVINVLIITENKSQIRNLTFHFKKLEEEKQG